MIISLRLRNFYSIRDYAALDFTADFSARNLRNHFPENLIDFNGDKFVNILGLFGSNASGKSNVIKAFDFCRNLILNSDKYNEGDVFNFEPFKFDSDKSSEFYIDFITGGIEYEYTFELKDGKILSESLYYYPNKRRAKVFSREKTYAYSYGKGPMRRPTEIEASTGSNTLFLSRASSMNRPIAKEVYRFFLNEIIVGSQTFNISDISIADFDNYKSIILAALEVSDSDIIDMRIIEKVPGQFELQSFHRENPEIPFDFNREESEGTKRLLTMLYMLLKSSRRGISVFLDEFDLKLHLRLAEFILDTIRAIPYMQLVFTSHNSSLMSSAGLRHEQIVFVNKQNDGNTELIPLSDFKGIDIKTDPQKAYLQGRFDAIPYVGDIRSIISESLNHNEDA